MTRVAIYGRVSTQEQTAENQLGPLRKFCEARGWTVDAEFVDEGVSGTKTKRPALNRLMSAVRKREIDGVVVWKFDRFGRSTRHLVESLELFQELGITFVSMTEGIDTSTSTGKLILSPRTVVERSMSPMSASSLGFMVISWNASLFRLRVTSSAAAPEM